MAAPAASAWARPAAAGAWRAVEPCAQRLRLRDILARPLADLDRAAAGKPVRTVRACSDGAKLPIVAFISRRRRSLRNCRALPGRGTHALIVRKLCGKPTHQPRSKARGRPRAVALRRAYSGLGDRSGVLTARAVTAAAQAHGLDHGSAEAARRCQRGDSIQTRSPANRARSWAPRDRSLRQGPAARVLEPAIRRGARPAACLHARRHRT